MVTTRDILSMLFMSLISFTLAGEGEVTNDADVDTLSDTMEKETHWLFSLWPLDKVSTVYALVILQFIIGSVYFVVNHGKVNATRVETEAEGGSKDKFQKIWAEMVQSARPLRKSKVEGFIVTFILHMYFQIELGT